MRKQPRKVERSCIACRKKGDQQQFLRYVVSPEQRVVVDYRHRLPGRGAYTCCSRACIEKAITGRAFDRAFRKRLEAVSFEDVVQEIVASIGQRIEGLIGIARKAGATVSGASQLQSAFSRQEVRFLIVAEDAAAGSSAKMTRLAELAKIRWSRFSSQQRLGQLAGKETRSCLGIKDEQFAELLALEIQSLQQIAGEN